jgi:polar amino acid transport system permease protein
MSGFVAEWARELYQSTGINLVFLYDPFEMNRLLRGIKTTIYLAVLCMIFSVIIGMLAALAQSSRFRLLSVVVTAYVQLFRNTPPMIQLLFFYFALGKLLEQYGLMPMYDAGGWQEPYISNFGWAVISISMVAAAFNTEIFRSGIEAVPTPMKEAAEALGYTHVQTFIYIVFPLAFRICLPALGNNLVNLVKTTTYAYFIAVPETLYNVNQIWSDNTNVPEMMVVLFLIYVGLISFLEWVLSWIERRLKIPGY